MTSNLSFSDQAFQQLNSENYGNLIEPFLSSCHGNADAVAYECMGQRLDFKGLEAKSKYVAAYLQQALKLNKGDRVAVQLPNSIHYPIIAWGIMRAGMILVNTNPLYTKPEIEHQFSDAGVSAVFALEHNHALVSDVAGICKINHVIYMGLLDEAAEMLPAGTSLKDVLVVGADQEFTPPDMQMDDVAVLQYTGGTTGVAKGAVLTHKNLYASICMAKTILEAEDETRELMIAPMPLYHIYGFTVNVLGVLIRGGMSVLVPNPSDLNGLINTMAAYPFTSMAGINTLYAGLMRHPEFDTVDFSHVVACVAGGSALMMDVANEWERRTNSILIEGYGLSETSSNLCCNKVHERQLGTVGKPLICMEVKTINTNGDSLPVGDAGELLVRGPHVTIGYWNRPESTGDAIDQDGWFRTGDVAIIQEDGYVKIVDRIKDMIIVSGFNVYPNEIEDIVSAHKDIVECAVIGVPDDRTGEAVKLCAVADNTALTAAEIQDYCRQSLTAYKIPKVIEFMDALPKSAVGKILRRSLRD